jgi:hypothetical protein
VSKAAQKKLKGKQTFLVEEINEVKPINSWDEDYKKLSEKLNKLTRMYHSNHKYITYLFAEIKQIKEEIQKNGNNSRDSGTNNSDG